MTASFDKHELMAGLAELEKRVREHRPSNDRPAAAPGDRLDLDLAAIEAALKAKSAAKSAANAAPGGEAPRDATRPSRVLNAAPELRVSPRAKEGASVAAALEALTLRVDNPRDLASPSRSATIELVAQRDPAGQTSAKLGAIENATRIAGDWSDLPAPPHQPERIDSAAKVNFIPDAGPSSAAPAPVASAPKRPHRWIYAAAAILIVFGTLVGGAGWLVSGKVLAALKQPSSPAPKAMAALPAPELKTETAPPVAAAETASAAPAATETASAAPAATVEAAPPASAAMNATPESPPQARPSGGGGSRRHARSGFRQRAASAARKGRGGCRAAPRGCAFADVRRAGGQARQAGKEAEKGDGGQVRR